MEIGNKFEIGDKVKIIVADTVGIITTIAVYPVEIKYWVEYTGNDGTVGGRWFYDFELEKKG